MKKSNTAALDWFERWFDTPYYHLLYAHRDATEAAAFLDVLLGYLSPPAGASIIDLGCGAGRHAHYLAERGYRVTGLDLSAHSIAQARALPATRAAFRVHDMRERFCVECAQYVLSLFTSMGFFATDAVQSEVLNNVYEQLVPGGYFVLDYLNSVVVSQQSPTTTTLAADSVLFTSQKWVAEGAVHKRIDVQEGDQCHTYEEHVWLYTLAEWTDLLAGAGLEVRATFGSYTLEAYEPLHSPRLIVVAQRKA